MTTYVTITQTEINPTINRNVVTVTPNVVENIISISSSNNGGSGGVSVTLASRVSILGTSPTAGSLVFSTDTHEFFVYTGSVWYKATLPFIIDTLVTATGLNFSIAANSQYIPMVNS